MERLKKRKESFRDERMNFTDYRSRVVASMVGYYDPNFMVNYEVCVYVDGILHRAYYNIFCYKEMNKIFHKSVKNVLKIKPAPLDLENPF